MNRSSQRVLQAQASQCLSELRSGSIRSRPGEVASNQRLYRAEDVSGSPTFVLGVPSGRLARPGGHRRADISMQWHRLFIQADHRFLWNIGLFVQFQQILHLADVGLIHFRHAPHFFPATA